MPAYDYVCQQCGSRFEVRMSISAYSSGERPPCGSCGSTDVARAFTTVTVLTSGRGSSGASAGGGCGHSGFT